MLASFTVQAQQVSLEIPEKTVDPGQTFSIDIKASDFDDIASMQFTIFWNPSIIQFQSVGNLNSNMPDFTTNDVNFNVVNAPNGKIRVIWYWFDPFTNSGVTLDDDATLFSLNFKAVGGQGTNSMLEITDDTTVDPPFAIEVSNFNQVIPVEIDNGKVTISGVNASSETITEDFILFQNSPNPFTETTYITFNLTTGSEADLSIYDNSGKIIVQRSGFFPAGLNRIPVQRDMLNSAGSYLYTLKTERATATRQLIMQ